MFSHQFLASTKHVTVYDAPVLSSEFIMRLAHKA